MNNKETEKQFATYQLKIPHELWKKFKIKVITNDDGTCGSTMLKIIEGYVKN